VVREHAKRQEAGTAPVSPAIVTWHGEGETHWHVVDRNAPEADQPAVLRTFSSRNGTREDARRFLAEFPQPSL
jgi:hypothetical protein